MSMSELVASNGFATILREREIQILLAALEDYDGDFQHHTFDEFASLKLKLTLSSLPKEKLLDMLFKKAHEQD
jgi:hypothetical protein